MEEALNSQIHPNLHLYIEVTDMRFWGRESFIKLVYQTLKNIQIKVTDLVLNSGLGCRVKILELFTMEFNFSQGFVKLILSYEGSF